MRYFWRHWPHRHVPFRTDEHVRQWYCGRCLLGVNWVQTAWEWLLSDPRVRYRRS